MSTKKHKQNTQSQVRWCPPRPETFFHILLAEDDYEMRRMLAWSLRETGYEVTECDDGYCLMKRLGFLEPFGKTANIDLIISDIRMPGVTGMQVLESAKEFEDFPPMILITAFADDLTHAQAQKLGAVAMFDKPFDVDDLLAGVAQVIRPHLPYRKKRLVPSKDEEPSAQFPMDIVFRHNCGSEPLKAFIQEMAGKLNRYVDRIKHCQVVIDEPNVPQRREHQYDISINLTLPGETVTARHDSNSMSSYENAYLAIRVTFGKVYHQMKHRLGQNDSRQRRSEKKCYEHLSEE
jgi:CheY-like chemotaxis protein/ribosome-associated translation inhibitor RaiA